MSAWLDADQYLDYFNSPDSNLQGGITASMSGGSFIGAIAAGFLADKLGRKLALQIACIIFIIGCAIVCSSQNVGQLIAGRIVNGLAIGICSSQVRGNRATLGMTNTSKQHRFACTLPNLHPAGLEVESSVYNNGASSGGKFFS